jgi:class 3 adenylate cyclase
VQARPFDLVLLDLMLPEFNGYQVLNLIKSNPAWRHLPVIMLSGAGDSDSVIRCIEAGAEDYLAKPFNPVLLRARIEASLEKKRLHDQERAFLKQLEAERETSERLLLNILPRPIADRLKHGEGSVVDNFAEITVLFADLAGFTRLTASLSPRDLVSFLNEVFSEFDRLAEAHGLEKIKTIGDAYMVVGGLPTPRSDHAEAVAEMALDMLQAMEQFSARRGTQLGLRIGIHTGPVIAGIIGKNKFSYDLWGDTVNIASRMESQGQPGSIQMTAESFNRLQGKYRFEKRGRLEVKGKGEMTTYLLTGRLPLSPAG